MQAASRHRSPAFRFEPGATGWRSQGVAFDGPLLKKRSLSEGMTMGTLVAGEGK